MAIHRIRTREFEVEGDIMMIVAALAVAFNVVLGLLLHGVCQIPHSHSHHSHLPETETHTEEESDNDESESQVRMLIFKWQFLYYHSKVNSVQKTCAKCFAVHILEFEILQIT